MHLGAEGLEVIELVAERLPLLGLDLCQSDKGVDNQENRECSYLLSMKMRTVNCPANFSEVMWTNLRPFLVSDTPTMEKAGKVSIMGELLPVVLRITIITLDSRKITKVKLARVSLPVRRGDGSVRLAKLLGCLRLKRTHTCGCSAWG